MCREAYEGLDENHGSCTEMRVKKSVHVTTPVIFFCNLKLKEARPNENNETQLLEHAQCMRVAAPISQAP